MNNLYLLDGDGRSHICNPIDDNTYICSAFINGKAIIYKKNEDSWYECDIDLKDNNINMSSCNKVEYKYILLNEGDFCRLKKGGNTIYTTEGEDFPTQCCSGIFRCGSVGENKDNSDKIFDNRYSEEDPPKNKFACLKSGGKCVSFPDDFTPEKYPLIDGDKIFDCNKCNCCGDNVSVNSDMNVNNVNNLCGICPKDSKVDYNPPDEIKKYTCTDGKCVPDKNGYFYGEEACKSGCKKDTPDDKNFIRNIIIILSILFVIFIILFSAIFI